MRHRHAADVALIAEFQPSPFLHYVFAGVLRRENRGPARRLVAASSDARASRPRIHTVDSRSSAGNGPAGTTIALARRGHVRGDIPANELRDCANNE